MNAAGNSNSHVLIVCIVRRTNIGVINIVRLNIKICYDATRLYNNIFMKKKYIVDWFSWTNRMFRDVPDQNVYRNRMEVASLCICYPKYFSNKLQLTYEYRHWYIFQIFSIRSNQNLLIQSNAYIFPKFSTPQIYWIPILITEYPLSIAYVTTRDIFVACFSAVHVHIKDFRKEFRLRSSHRHQLHNPNLILHNNTWFVVMIMSEHIPFITNHILPSTIFCVHHRSTILTN